jgi:hypothetical protein
MSYQEPQNTGGSAATVQTTAPNFKTEEGIRSSILAALHFAFGPVDASTFRQRLETLSDFAAKYTKSPLTTETARYQSLLIYLSLIFLAIQLFGPNAISVITPFSRTELHDAVFMALFSALIIAVALIFAMKVFVDYTVAGFTITSETFAALEVANSIPTLEANKTRVDNHYVVSLLNIIGQTHRTYEETVKGATGYRVFPSGLIKIPEDFFKVNFEELGKGQALSSFLEDRKEFISEVKRHLEEDLSNCTRGVKSIKKLGVRNWQRRKEIKTVYSTTLEKWVSAGKQIGKQFLFLSQEEVYRKRTDAIRDVLRRARIADRIIKTCEVTLPIAFALLVLGCYWFLHLKSQQLNHERLLVPLKVAVAFDQSPISVVLTSLGTRPLNSDSLCSSFRMIMRCMDAV